MKHCIYVGLAAVVGAVGSCNVAQAATYDETTGYVVCKWCGTSHGDSPWNAAATDSKGKYYWSDNLALHSGTNYYSGIGFRSSARNYGQSASNHVVNCNRFVLDGQGVNWKWAYPSFIVFANEGLFVTGGTTFFINDNAGCPLGGVAGTITVQDTSASKFFTWQTSTPDYDPGHGFWVEAKIVGDEDQYMRIITPADQSGRVYFMGDMSEYLGTINTISNVLYAGSSLAAKAVNATQCGEVLTCGADGAEIFIPNVTLDANSAIGCAATNTLVVDTLSLADGSTVRGFFNEVRDSGCVQVTNSFTAAGTIHVTVDMPVNGATNDVTRIAVLRVAKSAGTITQDQVELGERSSLAGVTPATLPDMTGVEVVEDEEWTTVYVTWRQVIRQMVSIYSAGVASKFNQAASWSNLKTPTENAGLDFYSSYDCYIPRSFPGRSFTTTTTLTLNGNGAYNFSNLTVGTSAEFRMWPHGLVTFNAAITVLGTSANTLIWQFGQSTTNRLMRPITSAVTQKVCVRRMYYDTDMISSLRLAADNSDTFTGKWIISHYEASRANPTQYMAFAVCEQANLGKPFDSFTYDALTIANWQSLEPDADDVVLDDMTRGIWLQGNAQLITPSGRSLTLESPVTWAGTVHKSGSGTLVLASPGKPTYVGSSQTTTPVEGTNMLTVAEGGIKAATTNAVDGLALVFDAGAKLVLDLEPENEEIKDWGLYDVKWATPITLGDGATEIAVEFADAESTPPATVFTRAVATVPSDQAASVKGMLAMPRPWKSYDYSLTVRDNGDSTSTILATYKPSGCTIILR